MSEVNLMRSQIQNVTGIYKARICLFSIDWSSHQIRVMSKVHQMKYSYLSICKVCGESCLRSFYRCHICIMTWGVSLAICRDLDLVDIYYLFNIVETLSGGLLCELHAISIKIGSFGICCNIARFKGHDEIAT